MKKCIHCGSENVYCARHDSVGVGETRFYPVNGQKDEELNLDIDVMYCDKCLKFWDADDERI